MAYKHHKQYILLAITAMPIEHAHYKYVVQDHLFFAHVHNWPSMCKQRLSTIYRHAQGKLYRGPIQHAFGSLINYTLQNLKQYVNRNEHLLAWNDGQKWWNGLL